MILNVTLYYRSHQPRRFRCRHLVGQLRAYVEWCANLLVAVNRCNIHLGVCLKALRLSRCKQEVSLGLSLLFFSGCSTLCSNKVFEQLRILWVFKMKTSITSYFQFFYLRLESHTHNKKTHALNVSLFTHIIYLIYPSIVTR